MNIFFAVESNYFFTFAAVNQHNRQSAVNKLAVNSHTKY